MQNERDIKDIYARKAECRSDSTIVKSYIPPQFFNRFSALNRICADKRSQDESLKTQIRFGDRDLIVLTKVKGSQDAFEMEDLEDFTAGEELPAIDLKIRWRFHEDRPPRRRVASRSPDTPAGRQRNNMPVTEQLTRQHSQQEMEEDLTESKRMRLTNKDAELPSARNMDETL